MTYTPSTDTFGRLRVSEPATVYDCKLQYDLQPLLQEQATAGGGSVTHDPDSGSAILATTGAAGDYAISQSRQYCTYQAGKGHHILTTGALGEPAAGVRTRMGYGDDENGLFLERDTDGLRLVFRSKVTGVVVEERVEQDKWVVDQFRGKGPSHINLDMSHSQIFVIDLQWLGVGIVMAGFSSKGQYAPAHVFYNDNKNPATYWTTATLPIRYEIEQYEAGAPGSMRQICCSVQSEGGFDLGKGFSFGAMNTAAISVTTSPRPILSVRPKVLFNSITNRSGIIPVDFDVAAASNAVLVELVYNGTLTGASWSAVDTQSACERDSSATAITGGTVVWRGVAASGSGKSSIMARAGFPNLLWLTNNIAGDTTTPLTLVARSAAAGSADAIGALRWTEIR